MGFNSGFIGLNTNLTRIHGGKEIENIQGLNRRVKSGGNSKTEGQTQLNYE